MIRSILGIQCHMPNIGVSIRNHMSNIGGPYRILVWKNTKQESPLNSQTRSFLQASSDGKLCLGQTVEMPQGLSGKICPWEVPREIQGTSRGQISRQSLMFPTVSQTLGFKNQRGCDPQGKSGTNSGKSEGVFWKNLP